MATHILPVILIPMLIASPRGNGPSVDDQRAVGGDTGASANSVDSTHSLGVSVGIWDSRKHLRHHPQPVSHYST